MENIPLEALTIGRSHSMLKDEEIEFLESWITSGKPDPGCNTFALPPPPPKSQIGRLPDGSFSSFSGAKKFIQLPISENTKQGLKESKYLYMTHIQRASLPHSLCGDRDIFGTAVTGSGKTLAFVIPVLEKLYRAKWSPEDGVGCIISSPTRELADRIFKELNLVGKKHDLSTGLLIDGRKGLDTSLNILVSTPCQLLKHMNTTPEFDCSQLQVLVLDGADRILDIGFKKSIDTIIPLLPKQRQTLLFSSTQTKSVDNLVKLLLKENPEYIGREPLTATPAKSQQQYSVVPADQKLDMLWSFVKEHIRSRMVVFLSTCKQVKFIYEAFRKLHPGVSVKCLHGRMKMSRSKVVLEQFFQKQSILFTTDLASRGLDFTKGVDWIVQVDCPENVSTYIHRVGTHARFSLGGKSILFLVPSETKMVNKLREEKVSIRYKVMKRFQPVSGLLSALLVQYPNLRQLAEQSLIMYLKFVFKQKDKEVFDLTKFRMNEFSASLGLPMTPRVRFLKS